MDTQMGEMDPNLLPHPADCPYGNNVHDSSTVLLKDRPILLPGKTTYGQRTATGFPPFTESDR